MPYKDKQKRNEANRRWYRAHRVEQMARVRKQGDRLRDEVRQYKESKPCTDCGKSYPYYVMDFDHVAGEKVDAVANLIKSSRSRRSVFVEIDKCELVCANCHRVRTHNRHHDSKQKRVNHAV